MAFCRFCGKQIPDGTSCNCQQNTVPQNTVPQGTAPQPRTNTEQATQMASKAGEAAKNAFNNFKPYLKSFVKSPNETISDAVHNKCFNISLGFAAVHALALIVVLLGLIGAVVSASYDVDDYMGIDLDISLPIFRIMFGGILMAAAVITLSAVTLIVFAKLGKATLSFKQAFIVASFRTFWPSVVMAGIALIALFSPVFGGILALLGLPLIMQMITFGAINDIREYSGCRLSTTGKTFLVPFLYIVFYVAIAIVVFGIMSWCFAGY